MNGSRAYDAIVVGLGAMGSATLFHLAERGLRVLGLEQFSPGHELGSSHGDSRIIREMYFENPLYVPLVRRAHELWRELEKRSGKQLMTIGGGLMIGRPDGAVVRGTLRSAEEHDLPREILDPSAVRARFPAFSLAEDLVAVLDPRAGFLDPEACGLAHTDAARSSGAELRFNERVLSWKADGTGAAVITPARTYLTDRLVIAAGGWSGDLLRELGIPLAVERQAVFWLEPELDRGLYDVSRFPVYAYEYEAGSICYGFPRLPRGVKASVMHGGETARDPGSVRRSVEVKEVEPLRSALAPVLPGLASAPVVERGTCVFTNTPDHDFIIDFHPLHPQVLISSPCSGHGFKFASAIGELQAGLLTDGRSGFDLAPFRLNRWRAEHPH